MQGVSQLGRCQATFMRALGNEKPLLDLPKSTLCVGKPFDFPFHLYISVMQVEFIFFLGAPP